jgi:hypothetical protein
VATDGTTESVQSYKGRVIMSLCVSEHFQNLSPSVIHPVTPCEAISCCNDEVRLVLTLVNSIRRLIAIYVEGRIALRSSSLHCVTSACRTAGMRIPFYLIAVRPVFLRALIMAMNVTLQARFSLR